MNQSAKEIVVGQLSEFDLPTLLHTFSVCRQVMALEVFDSSGRVAGRVILKGGKVVAASAGLTTGIQALRKIMSSNAQARFRVLSEGSEVGGDVVPLGSVHELVAMPDAPPRRESERVPMMGGSLEEFDVATLMQAVCIGRQYTELDVIGPTQKPIGTIFLQAGKVVSAKAGTIEGLEAIHHLLDTPKSYQFAVYRNLSELPDTEPLGSVGDILIRALAKRKPPATAGALQRPPPAPNATALMKGGTLAMRSSLEEHEHPTAQRAALPDPSRVRIMEGSLSEFDVPTLLQVADLGRQQVLLEVFDGHRLVGGIWVKAGMVLRAVAGHLDGTAAVQRIIELPNAFTFVMSRISGELGEAEPLGSLQSTLLRAATSSELTAGTNARPMEASSAVWRPQAPAASSGRIPVMEGSLSEFDVPTLLETVGFMRQHAELEIRNDNALVGSVHLRSNMVLRATAGTVDGVAAVERLLDAPKTARFAVFRSPAERDDVEPMGSSSEILRRARAQTDAPPSQERMVDADAVPIRVADPTAAALAVPSRTHGRTLLFVMAGVGLLGAAALLLHNSSTNQGPAANNVAPQPTGQVASGLPITTAAPPASPLPTVAAPAAPERVASAAQPTTKAPTAEQPAVNRAPVTPPALPTTPTPPARVLNGSSVASAQALLKKLGYDPGPIDGIHGPLTFAAVREFQTAEHLNVDGTLNAETRSALSRSEERHR